MTALADIAFDAVLAVLILGAGLAAVTVRGLFGAVVFFIVYGVFVAVAWLRLGAIDVALAEAALGAGLTGVLLLGAVARLPLSAPSPAAVGTRITQGTTALVALIISGGLGLAFLRLPPANGLQAAVASVGEAAGTTNPVTAVLLNFRAWDTLLEGIILLVALIGVWSVSRDADWGARVGLRQHARPGGVLASFGRLLPPVGLLLGVYLVWAGSSQPGGAFQGGTVLAAVWLLVLMAGLMHAPRVTSRPVRLSLVVGPAVFLGVGLAGALLGTFLGLPPAIAKQLILGIEAALTLSIAVTLGLLVAGPPAPQGMQPADEG